MYIMDKVMKQTWMNNVSIGKTKGSSVHCQMLQYKKKTYYYQNIRFNVFT